MIALGAAALVGLLGVLSSIGLYSLLSRAESGQVVSQADFDAAVSRENLISIGRLLVEIPASLLFIFWFHRAYTNLPAVGATGLPYSPGWAVGAWFVPLLNVVWPKRMMDAIWKASDPGAPPEQGESWRSRRTPSVLTWWWFFLIAMVIFAANWGLEGETIEQVQRSTINLMVRDLMRVGAWVVTLYVVREVTSRQEQRARRRMRH